MTQVIYGYNNIRSQRLLDPDRLDVASTYLSERARQLPTFEEFAVAVAEFVAALE